MKPVIISSISLKMLKKLTVKKKVIEKVSPENQNDRKENL